MNYLNIVLKKVSRQKFIIQYQSIDKMPLNFLSIKKEIFQLQMHTQKKLLLFHVINIYQKKK